MWRVSEDKMLEEGVKKYGPYAWQTIAASMFNHSRSWRECKERFGFLTEKVWTIDEDARLEKEVAKFGLHVQWASVASVMKHPLESCRTRYLSLTNPDKTRTPAFKKVNANLTKIPQSRRSRRTKFFGMKKKIEL